jgi:hypothetical protein
LWPTFCRKATSDLTWKTLRGTLLVLTLTGSGINSGMSVFPFKHNSNAARDYSNMKPRDIQSKFFSLWILLLRTKILLWSADFIIYLFKMEWIIT